ncbi:MAG: cytochrome c [Blastocatellia bacterium]|nr:cytochrome c [Blastocatellia bacterium]
MSLRNNRGAARRLSAMVLSIYAAVAITWYGTGSASDLSLGKERGPGVRSRTLRRNAGAQAQEPRRDHEAQKLKNPEPQNAESVEAGKKLYQRHCAACHGPNGKGDGGMALSGGEPSDLTDDAWDHGSTDGEIFVVIRDGVSADMLAYREKLTDKQIWQIVNYIRSIGPKQSKERDAK